MILAVSGLNSKNCKVSMLSRSSGMYTVASDSTLLSDVYDVFETARKPFCTTGSLPRASRMLTDSGENVLILLIENEGAAIVKT